MQKQRGFILLMSVFLVLFLGIFLSMALLRSQTQLGSIDRTRAGLYAFYAAEAGIDDAIFQLRNVLNWTAGFLNKPLIWQEGTAHQETVGTYTVIINAGLPLPPNNIPTLWIDSTGQSIGPAPVANRNLRARVTVENPADFFTSTISDLVFGSGATVGAVGQRANVLGRDITFDINSALPAGDPRRKITIYGDVEYIRNLVGYPDANGEVVLDAIPTQRPPLTFVGVDLARYRALAQDSGRYVNGDLTIAGDIDWATMATANGLVFAEGNVSIQGNVKESLHIVAAGNIYINGDIVCLPDIVTGVQAQIGLSASQDVIISASGPNTINIDAMVIADGGIFEAQYPGYPKDALNFNGVIAVRGKIGVDTAISLNVFTTRNLTYDAALQNNPTIPFLAMLVNIVQWQDLDPPPPLIGLE